MKSVNSIYLAAQKLTKIVPQSFWEKMLLRKEHHWSVINIDNN